MNDVILPEDDYGATLGDVLALLEQGRQAAARSINALMTATYWRIGHRIVEFEQGGAGRAAYGQALLQRLSADLTKRFGRGFGVDNLELMRLFYQAYPAAVTEAISESADRKSASGAKAKSESAIRNSSLAHLAERFPLSWTHYVHLMRRTRSDDERRFYEGEALRGGWSVRQLDRQIGSQFYERTALSTNKAAMLVKGAVSTPENAVALDDTIKDPYVLEFLRPSPLPISASSRPLHQGLCHRFYRWLSRRTCRTSSQPHRPLYPARPAHHPEPTSMLSLLPRDAPASARESSRHGRQDMRSTALQAPAESHSRRTP